MRERSIGVGPLRSSLAGRRALVDVRYDGAQLTLTAADSWLGVAERYRLVLLAAFLALVIGGGSADPPGRGWLLVASLVPLGVLLVLVVIEIVLTVAGVGVLAVRLFTRTGRRALLEEFRGVRDRQLAETVLAQEDIRLMDPVAGGVRPTLTLHTTSGELTLRGWPWRRRQLERLERALARW